MKVHGIVKMWSPRGFGFISRDDGQRDVFIHANDLPDGMDELEVGARVEFEEVNSERQKGKTEAKNVTVRG